MVEATLVQQRENNRLADEAGLLQLAVSSVLNKDAAKKMGEAIKSLKT